MFHPFCFFSGPPVPEASPYFTTTLDGNIHLFQARQANGHAYTETKTINIDSNLDAISSFIKLFIQEDIKSGDLSYKTDSPGSGYLRYHGLDEGVLSGKFLQGDTMKNLLNFLRAYIISRAANQRLHYNTFVHRDALPDTEDWMLVATDTIGVTDENELLFEESLLEILSQYLNNNDFFHLLHRWVFSNDSPIHFKMGERRDDVGIVIIYR